jgi:hypothetical protein
MRNSLKTFASNISSKETEVLNAVKTKSQTEDENIWTIWKAGLVMVTSYITFHIFLE